MTNKRLWRIGACVSIVAMSGALAAVPATGARQIERLDRGVVAVPAIDGGNLVSWRLLATDAQAVGFNLYRDGVKLNAAPLTGATNYRDTTGTAAATYAIKVVVNGREQDRAFSARVWQAGYGNIPIQQPAAGTNPDGSAFTYTANDASVGDLDGDGRYEIVLKWDPSNSKDNAQSGVTGPVILDAYTLDGRRLWRINLGRNIRAGAHYTQFMVQDFDGDGRAEVVMKTADGTTDGEGRVIGDAAADHRNAGGYILRGPEFLTVFQGTTGRALSTIKYVPGRHPNTENPTPTQLSQIWGDNYGNRSDRFLAGVAYLDGSRPSIIMGRGYYTRSTIAAFDFRNGQLTQRWFFDSAAQNNSDYAGQGNHNLSIADVDNDGRDEVIYGSMAINDDGTPMWSARVNGIKVGHGDALHVGDLDPNRPGLERFGVHEDFAGNGGIAATMMDARTGQVLWTVSGNRDNGRGVSADIDPRYVGEENWSARHVGLMTANGTVISSAKPAQTNFAIWWDGDRLREFLDGTTISKWDWTTGTTKTVLSMTGTISANGTKATPALAADILGDWREEVVMAAADNQSLRIYATPYATDTRLVTLMHDPVYRNSVAWQNVAYNQPTHTGFYLGETSAR
ncbi:rhamnogalacturonan lyase [Sphingomonas cynarae]